MATTYSAVYNPNGGTFLQPRHKIFFVLTKVTAPEAGDNCWTITAGNNSPINSLKYASNFLKVAKGGDTYEKVTNTGMNALILCEVIPIDSEVRIV